MTKQTGKSSSDVARRVTVRDIAAEIGVHFTTVAEALRDSPRVKEATKKKVRAAAEQMGYRSDPMLSALSAYRTRSSKPTFQGTLVWINGFGERDFFSKGRGFYTDCFAGARRRCQELGYRLEPFWMSEPGMSAPRASQILDSRKTSGVIVGPMPHGVDELDLFWEKFCSVRIGYSLRSSELTTIISDQFGNARMLFDRFKDAGYRRIGFACPQALDDRTNNHWSGSYLASQQHYPQMEQLHPFIDRNNDKSEFLSWMEAEKPDALICGGGRRYSDCLEAAGYRIPEQLSIACLHADSYDEDLAGIMQNGEIVGTASVDHLVAIIHRFKVGLETHPKVVTVSGKWKDGTTFKSS
ncbi:LacI family DNA-binding transcriptional regulator [Pelagicoccus enzymogenes]|uniref:LacI family DNA-binding transcriptional regulator n=1 Tax=Pelagicoccus enzymogenes TaxID=2773457 RepID=UPI00280E0126|nr:LacI family DNA-binding transcriptional regulator [Pelagicoccus enzymogenes]MDQ8200150.1 LacI family DNA-binding transcriptional regulator [Pelagicoccus enzymogenes]